VAAPVEVEERRLLPVLVPDGWHASPGCRLDGTAGRVIWGAQPVVLRGADGACGPGRTRRVAGGGRRDLNGDGTLEIVVGRSSTSRLLGLVAGPR
jgi:hypothetical protein